MSNTIEIAAQFDYRGQTYTPRATIDLDDLMARSEEMPDFHQWLATENGIGLYSYEYEVLESVPVEFSNASGLAAEFVAQQQFDFEGFRRRWFEAQRLRQLAEVARTHLGVKDLSQQPALSAALLEAYRLGSGEQG